MYGTQALITFLGVLAVTRAINPDNICVLVKDGTKIVDDTNCDAYYICDGGKAIPSKCPSGQYFSKDGRSCQPQSTVSCGTSGNPCQGISGEKFVSMPGSCSGYYYCFNGATTPGSCPGDLNFDQSTQSCKYKEEYQCSTSGNVDENPNLLCDYIPNGQYFGNAANCKIWLQCVNNVVRTGNCGDNVFNVQDQSCDYAENYNCQQLKGDSSETGLPIEACTVAEDGKVKEDPSSCSGYMLCKDKKYEYLKCGSGLYFNPLTNTCTNRKDAVNDCDRCEGTTLTFVNAYRDNCEGYLVCSGGKTVSKGKCDSGYYFNEDYASCVKSANPNFEVCKIPVTTTTSTTTTTTPAPITPPPVTPPTPAPVPEPTPAPETEPTPAPETEPTPAPETEPTPAPETEPTPAPETEPTPAPETEPTPAPETEPTPAPETEPTPAPETEPTPAPETEPTPAPETEPTPAPETEPTPAPETEPTPAPETEPTPAPETEPTPAPETEPTPAPETEPTPAPIPSSAPACGFCSESGTGDVCAITCQMPGEVNCYCECQVCLPKCDACCSVGGCAAGVRCGFDICS